MTPFDSISANRARQVKAGKARFQQEVARIGLKEFTARQVALMNQAKEAKRVSLNGSSVQDVEPTPDICTTDE